jgi:CubicO group peptidase (beta-lactamase class C family)
MRPAFVPGIPVPVPFRCWPRWLGLASVSWLAACAPSEPLASPDEIERAKQLYTQCVEEELGMQVDALEISRTGDINVSFGAGYTEEGAALAVSICEPRIGFVLEPGGASVLGPPPNLGHPGSDSDVAALLAERTRLGFEGAVLAEFSGQRRVTTGRGTLALGSGRTPDAGTAFDCGSIMKQVTAAAIFLLEEAGSLSREQTLAEFFAGVPSVWSSVTLNQVLDHSAGFAEYHDTEGDFEAMDRATALAKIFAPAPRFEPGTERAYSNAGYTLLAALIEQVSGQAYPAFVHRRIFEPLGMTRTGFYGEPLWADGNVAVGRGADVYLSNDPARWPPPTWALLGNGGLVSTLDDLLKLAKALGGEGLFQPATRQAYQLAQAQGSIAGKPLFGYAGGNDFGFDAVVGQVPEDASYVVVASHVFSPISAEILGVELLQVLYGAVLEQPASY